MSEPTLRIRRTNSFETSDQTPQLAAGSAPYDFWLCQPFSSWLPPPLLVTFASTCGLHHQLKLPFWIRTGGADAGRQVLIAIAAAVITVIGVVFSITILALTLARSSSDR